MQALCSFPLNFFCILTSPDNPLILNLILECIAGIKMFFYTSVPDNHLERPFPWAEN